MVWTAFYKYFFEYLLRKIFMVPKAIAHNSSHLIMNQPLRRRQEIVS